MTSLNLKRILALEKKLKTKQNKPQSSLKAMDFLCHFHDSGEFTFEFSGLIKFSHFWISCCDLNISIVVPSHDDQVLRALLFPLLFWLLQITSNLYLCTKNNKRRISSLPTNFCGVELLRFPMLLVSFSITAGLSKGTREILLSITGSCSLQSSIGGTT